MGGSCGLGPLGGSYSAGVVEERGPAGQSVVLEGFFARVESVEGPRVMFLRVDEVSAPGRVGEAAERFRARYESGEEFAADRIWMVEPMVRLTALAYDEGRGVLRLKLERSRLPK